jgi:hypothetical protein
MLLLMLMLMLSYCMMSYYHHKIEDYSANTVVVAEKPVCPSGS